MQRPFVVSAEEAGVLGRTRYGSECGGLSLGPLCSLAGAETCTRPSEEQGSLYRVPGARDRTRRPLIDTLTLTA